MNLLSEKWIPVRRRNGERIWIAPVQLGDPDIVAFDANRPDFNGAFAQFAIGLLQTAAPVNSSSDWGRFFATPADDVTLRAWFKPYEAAFELDGAGARFYQDFSLKPGEGTDAQIASLLIESPGENTIKNNGDHFIKRDRVAAMCFHCAAASLLTLQINGPAGGSGHRTGVRGGGPLSTLLLCEPQRSLWHDLWLNVQERPRFLELCGDATKTAPKFTFPWLDGIQELQGRTAEITPIQVHPAHIFWAMPRRVRLDFDVTSTGLCDICGRKSDSLLHRYATKNYGLNYKGAWDHPLSPYYENKGEWLPVHPQPGSFGYRHWLAWIGEAGLSGKRRRARVIGVALKRPQLRSSGQLRLWVFGYSMDNMKARCWRESTIPLYGLADCDSGTQRCVEQEIAYWLAGAELAAFFLRSAVKNAWFEAEVRGDLGAVDAGFWSRTEPAFYGLLQSLIDSARAGREFDATSARLRWHRVVGNEAVYLFNNELVGASLFELRAARRIATASKQLWKSLNGPKIHAAMGLAFSGEVKLRDEFSTVGAVA